ncbi:Myosin motor domain-containing protein [Meloidogyne graminicola]|uniref:Myosin motor domain-containing protein n=1 Tax=Meloidogyne graminicola TaxID=189291 RepID=A0A8S9ZNU8_9BILA|nr:Myosin motor domain-containing protein [Meloidogyne graminicola]
MSYLASIVASQKDFNSDEEMEEEIDEEEEEFEEEGYEEDKDVKEEEDEELDEEEYEYVYEEYDEEEEDIDDQNLLKITELCEQQNNNTGNNSSTVTREEIFLDENLRRLIEAPHDEFERESAITLQLGNNAFWIFDKEKAFQLCRINENDEQNVTVEIINDLVIEKEAKDCGTVEKKKICIVSRQSLHQKSVSHLCSDMTQLSELNEPSVLECIRKRYSLNLIHTFSGLFCVVVNPWRNLPGLYSKEMRTHYAKACTTSTDLPPHVFYVAQSAFDGICSSSSSITSQSILITGESGAGKTENTRRIIEYLIDVSGNYSQKIVEGTTSRKSIDSAILAAGTVLEAFGNAQTIHNDNSSRLGKFIRLEFENDLLEKSRVVCQNQGDRNFHIFYRLIANSSFLASEKAQNILNKIFGCFLPKYVLFRFLNNGKGEIEENVHSKFVNDLEGGKETEYALDQLEFTTQEKAWIRELMIACILIGQVRFGERSGLDMSFVEGMIEIEAISELIGLNQPSKLVDALTQPSIKVGDVLIKRSQPLRINKEIDEEKSKGFIGVLDMAGFEIMERNSFEQFCINYTNEQQQEYIKEGIKWTEQSYGNDLQPTIDLIEKPLGILSLLQEECIVPNGSELSLLEKINFTICHYAGSVIYNVDGWLEKNRDLVDSNILQVLSSSQHPLLSKLFNLNILQNKRKGPAMAHANISFFYREQLNKLIDTIKETRAHFIRCIVPNHKRIPFQLNGPLAMHQLRCNGVLEGIRICQRGYPNRVRFEEFISRYRLLSSKSLDYNQKKFNNENARSIVENLCKDLEIDEERFQIGRNRLFCRVGLLSELEALRRTKLSKTLTDLQAYIRWYLTQIELKRRRDEWESLLTIQKSILFQLIPLVNDKRKLNELITENNELYKKIDEYCEQLEKIKKDLVDCSKRLERSEQLREEENLKKEELRSELNLNEELLERMEKKWDEQHLKIMRLNNTLGEQTKSIEKLEEERNELIKENEKLKENYRIESLERSSLEQLLNCSQEETLKLRSETTEILTEISRLNSEINLKDEQIYEQKEELNENIIQIKNLNNSIFEANEKLNELQPLLHSEKCARRKADSLADDLSQELNKMGEELDKVNAKRDAMKEQLRTKDIQIRKLERKLEDKQAEMDECVNELKKAHKRMQTELQQQLDDLRKKSFGLERENAQLKGKLEAAEIKEKNLEKTNSGILRNSTGRCCFERDQRDSSVDSDVGTGKYRSSYNSRNNTTTIPLMSATVSSSCSSSLYSSIRRNRRYETNLSESIHSTTTAPSLFESNLIRRTGTRTSSMGNLSSSISTSTSSSLRRAAVANSAAMITSLTATIDSGLLSRSPSSASTVSGCISTTINGSGNNNYMQSISQRLEGAEKRLIEKEREIQIIKQDSQLTKRELDVYKQSLQESERSRELLTKQYRQLNLEFEQINQKLKDEEELYQSSQFEIKKENEAEIALERKKNLEKMEKLIFEYESRIRQLINSQRSQDNLLERLTEAESQLDKTQSQLLHMERLQRTQSTIGETWEAQYRTAQSELESIRDENAALKSRIRRQKKQIELLTQENELSERVVELENNFEKVQTRLQGDKFIVLDEVKNNYFVNIEFFNHFSLKTVQFKSIFEKIKSKMIIKLLYI